MTNTRRLSVKQLAEDLGATWHEVVADDPAPALVNFAKENQITQIVLGASKRSRWDRVVSRASVVQRVLRFAGQSGVDVHVIARVDEQLAPIGNAADLARSIATKAEPAEGTPASGERVSGEPAEASRPQSTSSRSFATSEISVWSPVGMGATCRCVTPTSLKAAMRSAT